MKYHVLVFSILAALAVGLVTACDNGPSPQPTARATAQPSAQATSQPTQVVQEQPATTSQPTTTAVTTVVDAAPITPLPTPAESAPTASPVVATSTGVEMTALQALALLKPKALAWQPDVRLAMLANSRPGQQTRLLGSALGDPNVFEPTPGGKGSNWTLIAVSPLRGALAVSLDGTQVDLLAEGNVTDEMLAGFSNPSLSALDLATLDPTKLVDSDKLVASDTSTERIGIALIAPDGLGSGPLPTPQTGGPSPALAYQTFSADPTQQAFTIFDASTGAVVLDSTKP